MARNDSGMKALQPPPEGIQVTSRTTTERNLADQMSSRVMGYTPVVIDDQSLVFDTYDVGRCNAATADAEVRAGKLLDRAGIPEQADKHPGQLSGDPQQRVAIAHAIADGSQGNAIRRAHFEARPGDDQGGARRED